MRDLNNAGNGTSSTQREKAKYWLNLPCGTGFPVPVDSPLHQALEAGVSVEQLLKKWAGTMYVRDTSVSKPKFSYLD